MKSKKTKPHWKHWSNQEFIDACIVSRLYHNKLCNCIVQAPEEGEAVICTIKDIHELFITLHLNSREICELHEVKQNLVNTITDAFIARRLFNTIEF